MVSPSNIVFNEYGEADIVDRTGTNFNFLSVYLTGAAESNLNILVAGLRNGVFVYNNVVIASATNATLFTFNYLNIDDVRLACLGGQNAGFPPPYGNSQSFVMDNLTFEFVPEPSTLLLTAAGALALLAFHRRRQKR